MAYVITGGGSGIGRALTHVLATRGERVLIVGRREAPLLETKEKFPDLIDTLVADCAIASDRAKLAERVAAGGALKGLVHNAAVIAPICPIAEVSLADWRKHQAVNVEAPLFLTQALLPYLSSGRVLMISSGAAHRAIPAWSAYCTGKAALDMLWMCFKEELSQQSIAFGSVMPGIVDTKMQSEIRDSRSMNEEDEQFFKGLKAEGRLLPVKTVSHFLAWLMCDVEAMRFCDVQWDIYDESHHGEWAQGLDLPTL